VRYLHVLLDLLQLISQFSEGVDDQTCLHRQQSRVHIIFIFIHRTRWGRKHRKENNLPKLKYSHNNWEYMYFSNFS